MSSGKTLAHYVSLASLNMGVYKVVDIQSRRL